MARKVIEGPIRCVVMVDTENGRVPITGEMSIKSAMVVARIVCPGRLPVDDQGDKVTIVALTPPKRRR